MTGSILLLAAAVALSSAADLTAERNKFVLYHGTGDGHTVFSVSQGTDILRSNRFSNLRKTVLYIHGYQENQNDESVQTIVNAYRQRKDYNILTLDWSEDASGPYFLIVLPRLKRLAVAVADKLLDMINAGLDLNKLHLVGFSLGGQMIGRIGSEIKKKSKDRVVLQRITALDPAFPGFYGLFEQHITKDDAVFVDIIHTDAWRVGAPYSKGHVDFWPNGGVPIQPGCSTKRAQDFSTENAYLFGQTCSQKRAWQFWAESVVAAGNSQLKFNAVSARHWPAFINGKVGEYDVNVEMGFNCPTNTRGDYYLQTNRQTPFARGPDGVTYDKTID